MNANIHMMFSLLATPAPYFGSAFRQLPIWRNVISLARISHRTSRIVEQRLLLRSGHQPEESARLRVVVIRTNYFKIEWRLNHQERSGG